MGECSLDKRLLELLDAERLSQLAPVLSELGVNVLEDIQDVEDGDLAEKVKPVQRKQFKRFQEKLLKAQADTSVAGAEVHESASAPPSGPPVLPTLGVSTPLSSRSSHRAGSRGGDGSQIDEEEGGDSAASLRRPILPHVDVGSAEAPADPARASDEHTLVAQRRPKIKVPYVSIGDDGTVTWKRDDDVFLREGQLDCRSDAARPEAGWTWLRAEFPRPPKKFDDGRSGLEIAARKAEEGLTYEGRTYYLASTSKSSFFKGSVAWLHSPPVHVEAGPRAFEDAIGWGERLRLQQPSAKRPHPEFLLRARVKQLFSAVTCVLPTSALQITVVEDWPGEDGGLPRDDGAGECDPDVAEALAKCAFYGDELADEENGRFRHVTSSLQIRSGGIKGMLVAVQRLLGTRRVEVPLNMCKFSGDLQSHHGPELGVISFSTVRPTGLSLANVLCFQARGVPEEVFRRLQEDRLLKVGGALTRKRAFRILKVDEDAEDPASSLGRKRTFLTSFVNMLQVGFDLEQHPLLQVFWTQQKKALMQAQRELRGPGMWQGRGHPEPRPEDGEEPVLFGNQVFFMYPADDQEWEVLTGKAIIVYSSDRSPDALRVAEGVDSERLRRKCQPGLLYFSIQGPRLSADLSWDFDGDYYKVIFTKEIVEAFDNHVWKMPDPVFEFSRRSGGAPTPPSTTLAGIQRHFITDFPKRDHIGLYHYHWELVAGDVNVGVGSRKAKELAANYSAALDVEKGGPWPVPPPFGEYRAKKWDFSKGSDGERRLSATVAGIISRMAKEVQSSAERRLFSKNALRPDEDLQRAWERTTERLGDLKVSGLQRLAKEKRGEFAERIYAEMRRATAANADLNLDTQGVDDEKDIFFEDWMEEMRSEAEASAAQYGATLRDLALIAWHMKYVQQGASFEEHKDVTFPWRMFWPELCEVKEQEHPCCQRATEKHAIALRRLRRAAAAAAAHGAGTALKERFEEAARDMQGSSLPCPECNRSWKRQAIYMALGQGASEVVQAMQAVEKEKRYRVPCSELFYCKAVIEPRFKHGSTADERLDGLKERIVQDVRNGGRDRVLQGLEVSAISHHGRLFVVEGNRRLWCAKAAGAQLGQDLHLKVRELDMCLGSVYSWVDEHDPIKEQRRCRAAFRTFWDKFTTRCQGVSVDVAEEGDGAGLPTQSAAQGTSSSSGDAIGTGIPEGGRDSGAQASQRVQMGATVGVAAPSSRPLPKALGRPFKGRYPGKCSHCGLEIQGTQVVKAETGWCHEQCTC